MTSLLTLGKLVEFIDEDDKKSVRTFRDLMPFMINTLKLSIDANHPDMPKGFEVFDTLIMLELPIVNIFFSDLVSFFISIASSTQLDDVPRKLALSFLMWTTVYKKSMLQKLKF